MFDITSRVVQLLGVGLTSNGQASLTSDTALAAAGTRKANGACSLTVESDLSASAISTVRVSITASFDSVFSGSATAVFRSATAALMAESDLSADGTQFYGVNAALDAQSGLSALGLRVVPSAVTLVSESQLGSLGRRSTFSSSAMSSDSDATLASVPVRIRYGESALEGDTVVTDATAYIRKFGTASMSAEATAFQATASPVFRLRMASAKRSITDDWLLKRYPIDAGLSLIVKNGVVTEVEVPSQTELAEADFYFLGGRNNPITPAQRATLIAAGFGSYIEED